MRSVLRPVRSLVLVGALALLPAAPAHAQSWTLDFAGFVNAQAIDQTYGDLPGLVDVSIGHRTGWGNTALTSGIGYGWTVGYNDLIGVAFTDAGTGVGEVTLDNISLLPITLNSADVGAWQSRSIPVALQVYDGLWNLLYSNVGATVGSTDHAHFDPGVFTADVLHVQWSQIAANGDPIDAFNVGIDNVAFTIAPTAVPEPATVTLFGVGLTVLAGAAARRRSARPV